MEESVTAGQGQAFLPTRQVRGFISSPSKNLQDPASFALVQNPCPNQAVDICLGVNRDRSEEVHTAAAAAGGQRLVGTGHLVAGPAENQALNPRHSACVPPTVVAKFVYCCNVDTLHD